MKVETLRSAFEAGRPLVQAWLDIAVQMAALRDDCRTKEIDWQQVKSLLKAQIQDAEEGTDKRVVALLTKADNATSYADALGICGGIPEKNISRDRSQQTVSIAAGTDAPAQKPVQQEPAARATTQAPPSQTAQARAASVAIARSGGDPFEIPDLPAHLDRRVRQ